MPAVVNFADRIANIPCLHRNRGLYRQLHTRHINDEVGVAKCGLKILGVYIADIDVLFEHDLVGQRRNEHGMGQPGAIGLEDVGPVGSREAFRHRAAARISDAKK